MGFQSDNFTGTTGSQYVVMMFSVQSACEAMTIEGFSGTVDSPIK